MSSMCVCTKSEERRGATRVCPRNSIFADVGGMGWVDVFAIICRDDYFMTGLL